MFCFSVNFFRCLVRGWPLNLACCSEILYIRSSSASKRRGLYLKSIFIVCLICEVMLQTMRFAQWKRWFLSALQLKSGEGEFHLRFLFSLSFLQWTQRSCMGFLLKKRSPTQQFPWQSNCHARPFPQLEIILRQMIFPSWNLNLAEMWLWLFRPVFEKGYFASHFAEPVLSSTCTSENVTSRLPLLCSMSMPHMPRTSPFFKMPKAGFSNTASSW